MGAENKYEPGDLPSCGHMFPQICVESRGMSTILDRGTRVKVGRDGTVVRSSDTPWNPITCFKLGPGDKKKINSCHELGTINMTWKNNYAGIEFKDFILGFHQSTFLCTTLKCIEKFRIPFIKFGIPASNLGSSEARNPAKFAACYAMIIYLPWYIFTKYRIETVVKVSSGHLKCQHGL